MSDGFTRTLQTAADAESIAKLLERMADGHRATWADVQRLKALAERYTDYAAALRETAEDAPGASDPEQAALL